MLYLFCRKLYFILNDKNKNIKEIAIITKFRVNDLNKKKIGKNNIK